MNFTIRIYIWYITIILSNIYPELLLQNLRWVRITIFHLARRTNEAWMMLVTRNYDSEPCQVDDSTCPYESLEAVLDAGESCVGTWGLTLVKQITTWRRLSRCWRRPTHFAPTRTQIEGLDPCFKPCVQWFGSTVTHHSWSDKVKVAEFLLPELKLRNFSCRSSAMLPEFPWQYFSTAPIYRYSRITNTALPH